LLDRRSGIPMYYQLKVRLRERILGGELVPGQQIPSEQQLARDHGVSKMTVRQALADLADEGLLDRRPGVGTFVAQRRIQRNLVGDFVTFFESQLDGRKPSSRVLAARTIPADGRAQFKLKLSRGEPVVRVERYLLLDGEPVAFTTIYIPAAKCPGLVEDVWQWQSLISLFENKHHLFPAKALQTVEAVKADERIARLLGVDVDDPLLYTERITYLEGDDPIEFTQSYLRSDRYTYNITLYRRKASLPEEESTTLSPSQKGGGFL